MAIIAIFTIVSSVEPKKQSPKRVTPKNNKQSLRNWDEEVEQMKRLQQKLKILNEAEGWDGSSYRSGVILVIGLVMLVVSVLLIVIF